MSQPLVSILMGAYNAEKHVGIAVESVVRQSYRDIELLVMDDGSTDRTGEILDYFAQKDQRVRVFHQENIGLTASLNNLIQEAKGEFLARLDADDLAYPDRLAHQVDYLLNKPEVGVVSCWVQHILENGNPTVCYCPPDDQDFITHHIEYGPNPLVHSSVMMRKSILDNVEGPYRFLYSQDIDLWMRLLSHTQFGVVEGVLIVQRQHGGQMSVHNIQMRLELSVYIRELHMRRKNGQEEGDWQEKQRQIVARFTSDQSRRAQAAMSLYLEGRTDLMKQGNRREIIQIFLKAMLMSRAVRTKAFFLLILTLMPFRISIPFLSHRNSRSNLLAGFFRDLDEVTSPQQRSAHEAYLRSLERAYPSYE